MLGHSSILALLVLASHPVLGAAVGTGNVQVPLAVDTVATADNIAPLNLPLKHGSPQSYSVWDSELGERYDGHQVWRLDWSRVAASVKEAVLDLLVENLGLDVWRASADTLDVRIPPGLLSVLKPLLPDNIPVSTFVKDVQTLVDGSASSEPPEGGWNVSSLASPFHDGYHKVDDIYSFGDALVEFFPDMLTSMELGRTQEDRPIRSWTAKIESGSAPDEEKDKVEIIVQSGQHAREWVATSAALYFLHSLLLDAKADEGSNAAKLLRSFAFTIIPVANPDGLAYSHDHSRLWKKNRQDVGGLLCKGIDLNGNWGYEYRPSRLVCTDSYSGQYAFEAHETRAISDYLVNGTNEGEERDREVKAFIDLHSYGQLFMFPFAYSCADFPPDAENLMEAGLGVAKAMRTTSQGEGYQCGQACDLTYRSTGDAIDFSYGSADVRWSYSAELRDTGTYGFILPPHLIRPTGEEVSAGLRYLATFIYETEIE